MSDLDDLLALERRGWDSLCDGTGAEFYGSLMTAEAVMVLAHGFALDHEQVRASLADAPPWSSYEITEPRLVPVGEHAAALVYRARATRGDEPAFEAWMTSVYDLSGPEPRLSVYQQTPIPS
ncbi:DUF4440 domain-containing protein [Nocardioides massiliensis]|uniref:DUF4440 domain-containing protein n=1 Tax=Nocardioides massiliensis TaxID=1325935 RepID=A0ABT9NNY3_9ACTN|nr:DUF4440 domain-containing protein [Nocardioides massiliensis]MDP9822093.1 hypothetical protein [Nocardioides massiliensis]